MKFKLRYFGLALVILGIIAISGCASTPAYKNDIQVGAATYSAGLDGTATGGFAVRNTGSSSYKQVEIALEIYDANGNLVGNVTKTIGMLAPGDTVNYFEVIRKVFVSGVSARAVVVDAANE